MKTRRNRSGFTLMELLVVSGIFALIIGVSFTILSTGRFSVNITESQIHATQQARLGIGRMVRELRLSRPSAVMISDAIGWTNNSKTGSVINFQVPVGSYSDDLVLISGTDNLQWGSADSENEYIAYSLDQNNQRLIRSTYTAVDGSDATSEVVANDIVTLDISRKTPSSGLVTVQITAQTTSPWGTIERTLTSSIKLRND